MSLHTIGMFTPRVIKISENIAAGESGVSGHKAVYGYKAWLRDAPQELADNASGDVSVLSNLNL